MGIVTSTYSNGQLDGHDGGLETLRELTEISFMLLHNMVRALG